MKIMRNIAPGEDEVRLDYNRKGEAEIIDRVVRIFQEKKAGKNRKTVR